jgi:hypothetical protein
MARMQLRPAGGLNVRKPAAPFPHLAAGGEEVELDTYWRRRLRAGDVVEIKVKRKAKGAK